MDVRTQDALARRLALRRDAIVRTVADMERGLEALAAEPGQDLGDQAQGRCDTLVLDRLDERERNVLERIDAAFDRIRRGAYGLCESCGRAISMARLDAIPEAQRCGRCARKQERGV